MEDLGFLLSSYMKQANSAMAAGEYGRAYSAVVHAAECTLMLAKKSTGVARDRYLANYQSLKTLLEQLDAKRGAGAAPPPAPQKPREPVAPSKPAAPSTPSSDPRSSSWWNALNTTPPKPAAPVVPPPQPSYPPAAQGTNGSATGGPRPGGNPPPAGGQKYAPKQSLSPQYLCDYIGQPGAVTAVKDLITAARIKNTALPHIIIYGSNGLGKSTFAKIIANEMRADFVEINVSKATPQEMIAILKKLKPKDILFIDEIHTLPLIVAESLLYSAMQDGRITYTEGKGKFARTETFNLPPFTLVGATTEIGKLAKPFTHRAITVRLEEYTDEVLGGIVASSINKIGMNITPELALRISKRCRNNPRTANNIVKRITDKALVRHVSEHNLLEQGPFETPDVIRKLNIHISEQIIDEFFVESGIDEYGLENGDRELLKMIIHRYKGGPVGLDNLARAMNESNNVIAQKYEAYLIKKGLIRVDRDGRVAMPEAYKVLGLDVPEDKKIESKDKGAADNSNAPDVSDNGYNPYPPTNNGYNPYPPNGGYNNTPANYHPTNNPPANHHSAGNPPEAPKSRYDSIKIIAGTYPEPLKCDKIEALITYPENARVVNESLDELFPEVEKPEVEIKKTYQIEIDFGSFKRSFECDSKLESKFAMVLASTGYVTDFKAQTLEIPYISQELANRRYFPDFVIRDYKGRIAVIEMKNYDAVSYHLNIDKYEHLRRFCEANGFGYAEIMKPYDSENYVSVDMLIKAPINEKLEQYIIDTIQKNGNETGEGVFTERDFAQYVAENGKTDRSEVYTILLNNRRLKNMDHEKTFRIKDNC